MFNFFGKKKHFSIKDGGTTWHLHSQVVKLRNGNGDYKTYFFAKTKRANACEMPSGYKVMYSPITGMPMLKKQ